MRTPHTAHGTRRTQAKQAKQASQAGDTGMRASIPQYGSNLAPKHIFHFHLQLS